ncbi:thrombospondin type 3 repeat-containing protein, partial [Pseudomonadales bacterium]|nr:thrombospondin type 3 repeat-containing protein [Pseudomonadales bacterium]
NVLDVNDDFPLNALLAADPDGDGVDSGNAKDQLQDNCPAVANADQTDTDNNGIGDACGDDDDGDGINQILVCQLTDDGGFSCQLTDDTDGDGTSDDLDPSPNGDYGCRLFNGGNLVCG